MKGQENAVGEGHGQDLEGNSWLCCTFLHPPSAGVVRKENLTRVWVLSGKWARELKVWGQSDVGERPRNFGLEELGI